MTLKKLFEKVEAYNEVAEMMRTRKAEIHFYLRDVICFGDHFDSFESLRKYIHKEYTKELADAVLKCSDWELDKEIDEAMKLLRPLLPIRFEKSHIAIKLNGSDYGRCYDDLISYGIVEKEEWTSDGCWIGVMEIPAGVIDDLKAKLNSRTKGHAEVKLIA